MSAGSPVAVVECRVIGSLCPGCRGMLVTGMFPTTFSAEIIGRLSRCVGRLFDARPLRQQPALSLSTVMVTLVWGKFDRKRTIWSLAVWTGAELRLFQMRAKRES